MTVLDPELYKIIRAEMERTDIPNRDRFVNVTRMVQDMLDEQAAALRQVTRCCSSCAAWAPRNKGDRTGECRSPRGPAAGLVTQADEWCDRWTGP